MKRYHAILIISRFLDDDTLAVFANGRVGREAYAHNDRNGNFYMLSSMGKGASIGLGIALARPDRNVFVIDGDGNALMNLDNFAMIGYSTPKNFVHIVLDNGEHATTGGQRSHTTRINLALIARGAAYAHVSSVDTKKGLTNSLLRVAKEDGPHFILVRIEKGDTDVPRTPHLAPEAMRDRFMGALKA